MLRDAGHEPGDALSFVAADLTRDAGWADAVAGCDFVLHVASPVHVEHVENEDDVTTDLGDKSNQRFDYDSKSSFNDNINGDEDEQDKDIE